jgi:predicted amidohydrolase YtcJ
MWHHKHPVDLILLNGDFRTQDPAYPRVRAVAIGSGRIMAVGDNNEIKPLADYDTEVIDLRGRLGIPGMTDCHFHYYDWALGRRNLRLSGTISLNDLMGHVSQVSMSTAAGGWILGQGWNEVGWPEGRMPNRDDLDAVTPTHPVFLLRSDLHLAVVNSLALELAQINEHTPDPPEGIIARDQSGRPNGILRDLAINLVKNIITNPNEDEIIDAMVDGIPVLHSFGITGIHDLRLMGGIEGASAFGAWQRLREAGNLNLRCWVSIPGERLDEAIALGLRTGFGDERLRVGHLKFFTDGAMGSRTAWLTKEIAEAIDRAEKVGLSVAVHAIGDRANREVVTIFEKQHEARKGGKRPVHAQLGIPHRIEHVQMILPEDLTRMARLDLVACVQPIHIIDDMSMIETAIGSRAKWGYQFRDMLDAGIPLIFSSDCPVADPNPLWGIHAAVTRQCRDGSPPEGWYPSQRITVQDAVWGYTMAPAIASDQEKVLGSITPGKYADIVILDRNIFAIDPKEIADTRVDLTIFNGRVVFQRQSLSV